MSSELEQKIANIFEGSDIKKEQFLSFWDRLSAQEQGELAMFVVEVSKETQATMEIQLQAAKAEADRAARIDELEQRKADYQEYLPRGNNNPYGYQKCIPEAYINARLRQLTTPKEDKETV